jgi:hypothetical protein
MGLAKALTGLLSFLGMGFDIEFVIVVDCRKLSDVGRVVVQ